ncbi:MAG TPA: hypothetical protein VMG12_30015 [Polyangiaceae bacterium]|nr:hypothetical protein [Polyangiaceae bacterium]
MSRDRSERRGRPFLVLATLTALACERGTAQVAATAAASAAPTPVAPVEAPSPPAAAPAQGALAAAPVSAADAAPRPASELIVGSARGLEAWSLDGSKHRVISPGAALHPRWLDAGTIVAIAPRDTSDMPRLSAGATLQRISLADGRRSELAAVPPFACKTPASKADPEGLEGSGWSYDVDLQDEGDFELDRTGHRACLRLLDRNVNMASVILDVHVNLQKHSVQRWLVTGEDVCPAPRGVRRGEPTSSCNGAAEPPAEAAPASGGGYAYDMPQADGEVIQTTPQGTRTALKLGLDYSPEARSPSGRCRVLGGDTVEGDYLYRRLSLLDRESGRVYPILEKAGAWPRAIEPSPGSPPTLPPIESAILAPGEADVRWLHLPEGEVLVVDSAVVRPGVGSFSVDGVLAR